VAAQPPPPPSATFTARPNSQDELLQPFLDACRKNNVNCALELVPGRDPGPLTMGLNAAIKAGHLALARGLIELGAKCDGETVNHAHSSLDVGKLIIEFGFKVNDRCLAGSVFLLYVLPSNLLPLSLRSNSGVVQRNDIAYI
jgi:hypothetical protein